MLTAEAHEEFAVRPIRAVGSQGRLQWLPVMVGVGAADSLALVAAFTLAYLVRFKTNVWLFQAVVPNLDFYISVVAWALPVWLGIFLLCRLYDHRYLFVGFSEYARVAVGCTVGALALIVISFFYEISSMARAWLIMVWLFSVGAVWVARFIVRRVVWRARVQGHLCRPTVVVGTNDEGKALAAQLAGERFSGARIVGLVTRDPVGEAGHIDGRPILGNLDDLERIVETQGIQDLIIAATSLTRSELLDLYARFGHDRRVELRLSSGLFAILTTGVRVQEIGSVPLMTLDRVRITGVDAFLKATLDLVGAGLMLLVLSPVMIAVAVAVRLDGPGPIIHRRRVVGRNGQAFDAFKFRTMIPDRRARAVSIDFADRRRTDKSEQDPRVTAVGKFLRRTSLDELPQLVNVLRGEMSLVGPRMISPSELPKFRGWQLNLLTVKPGITGPWQVRGRATLPYEQRVQLNMEYIRGHTIWRDLEILIRTVPAVVRGKGAF